MTPRRQHTPASAALRALRDCLRDTRGFMLAEQLVSIIFIGLLCVAVAAGLSAALSAYRAITTQTRADAMLSQTVEAVSDQLAFAQGDISTTDDHNQATFVSASTHTRVSLQNDASGVVLRNTDGSADGNAETVIAAARDGMRPSVSVSFDDAAQTWTLTIMILPANASGTETLAQVQDLKVQRIGR